MATLEEARDAAMNDIVLLRALVAAQDATGVKIIFATLPTKPILLDEGVPKIFFEKMRDARESLSVKEVVNIYNYLEQRKATQPHPLDGKGTPGVWKL